MRVRRAAVALVALLVAGCSAGVQHAARHVDRTLAYGSASPAQVLQLTRPAHPIDPGRSPWLLLLHGGGWIAGNPGQLTASTDLLTEHGYVVFSAGYRLLDAHTTFAQQWSDVVHAWRWVRAHATSFGVDAGRGAVWGASAGGHLAALLGNREPGVRAVVSLAGVLEPSLVARLASGTPAPTGDDYLRDGARTPTWLYTVLAERVVRRPWVATDPVDVAAWTAVDPGHYLGATSPPTLVVQGTADTLVPPRIAQAYGAELAAHGVPHPTVLVRGAAHAEAPLVAGARDQALAFLRDRLDSRP